MEREFVNYEIAWKMSQLGFNGPTFKAYDTVGFLQEEKIMKEMSLNSIPAPLIQQSLRWLREEHGINIVIEPSFSCYNISRITVFNENEETNENFTPEGLEFKDFKTYEEALEIGLQEALKLIP